MDESRIKVQGTDHEVMITANAAGLRKLAERLIGLADADVHDGYHEHLEVDLRLVAGSTSLILERNETV
ncbi:hypothetical protein ABT095_11295 [Kitasatospora sp. NPDC002227]|uniref:Imm32 family immunity protein n=1 Tax=Kitasatospora sp. NPDC002227 TaxID=3154773 RepID=UPI00332D0E30